MIMIFLHRTLFIGINFEPLFEDTGIPLALMGILVVFLALVLVAGTILLVSSIVNRGLQSDTARQLKRFSDRELDEELSEEMLVVIAAAVYETLRKPHRIVNIKASNDMSWVLEGRLKHHQSHVVKQRSR